MRPSVFSGRQPFESASQIADAAGCDGLRVRFEVEDFDGDVAVVGPVFEGFEDGGEFKGAEPRPAQVGIVGVKMDDVFLAFGDDLGNFLFLVAHGLDVEMEAEIGVIDLLDEADGLLGRVEEIRFGGGERFHRDGDSSHERPLQWRLRR